MEFVPAFEVVAEPERVDRLALFIHGIYGAGRNWRSFARLLADRQPTWKVALCDLRNHGASQGAPPPHLLESCAADLARLHDPLGGAPDLIYAHSFGGKVSLLYAREHARTLRELWLLDSPPGLPGGDPSSSEASRVLSVIRSVPQPLARRSDLEGHFARLGIGKRIAAWMATNLRHQEDEGFRWIFDFDALDQMLRDYWALDGIPILEALPEQVDVHCVRGGRSDRWSPADIESARRLEQAGFWACHLLADAAHWLHVDDANGLLEILLDTSPA